MAEQFGFNQIFRDSRHIQGDKRRFARGLWRCKACATSSLPVPDSPLINTLMDERDRRPIMRNTSCIAGASPMMSVVGPKSGALRGCCCSVMANGALNQRDGFVDIKWLGQVVECPLLIGANGGIQIGVCRHYDDRKHRVALFDLL